MSKKTEKKQALTEQQQAGDVLQLMIDQINAAVRDNNSSMAKLIGSHSAIAAKADSLTIRSDRKSLEDLKDSLHQELRSMIIAFQRHDEHNQRLEHVTDALAEAKILVENPIAASEPQQWQALVEKIAAKYTTAQELRVHENKTGVASQAVPEDDIELF